MTGKLKAYKGVKEVGAKYEKDIKNAFKGEQGIRIANTYYSPEELYKIYSEAENDFALVSAAADAGKKGIDESDREGVGGAISKKKLREFGQKFAAENSAPTGLYSKDILEKYKNISTGNTGSNSCSKIEALHNCFFANSL